jgi:hypothetical protein
MKKYIFIIFIFFSEAIHGQTLQPLTNNTLEDFFTDEKASNTVLERCISLYSAVTELTRIKYPDLASEFYEIANTLYPYGIISLSKTSNIPYEEAEKFFFTNVNDLTNLYIDEMKKNGEKNGSYFKWSFIGDDLRFCHEVTKSFNLVISELNSE